ncbi:uncharacterized protein LOC123223472 [Mangifera indica]|uniref:uncharacterized protein LOC123223472 n=1 Tax=Mangifera indica TaxID=29780 RepID=UPI001CFB1703|nr:uncharacterized protein LOC123223472 [Mangifera indica]
MQYWSKNLLQVWQLRHFARECPIRAGVTLARPKQPVGGGQARVYTITQAQAETYPSVVTGQLLFYTIPLYALIDSGATHSFIAQGLVERLRLKPTVVNHINTEMLDGDNILSDSMLLHQTVELKGRELIVDLIMFDMLDFDIILGMDFLSKYGAEIDCRKKKVKFNLDNGDEFSFSEGRLLSMMISSVRARKMLSKGCIGYLAHVVNKSNSESTLNVKNTLVVYEFLDVFPDNLSGLAPEREVEFSVELAPGHVVSTDGIFVNPSIVKVVMKWQRLRSAKEVMSFLGLVGYYRCFIEGFSKLARPLTELTCKDVPFHWFSNCEDSFQALKQRLTTVSVLTLSIDDEGYDLYIDASHQGFGAVLIQRGKWLELVKDYDMDIRYHSGKANVVVDALSMKVMLSHVATSLELQRDVFREQIEMVTGLLARDRVCVPQDDDLRTRILMEVHSTLYTAHPKSMKMYQDLRRIDWWSGMKKVVVDFVSKCMVCQQVKAEHQRPSRLLQPLSIPEWKWEEVSMDFMVRLPKVRGGFNALWVIVDRLTKLTHFIPVRDNMGTDQLGQIYIREIVKLHGVPKRIVSDRETRSFQLSGRVYKSYQTTIQMTPYETLYGRKYRSPLHWDEIGERNELTSVLGREMTQQMIDQIGKVAYKLALPTNIRRIHNAFHISLLRKCLGDPSQVVKIEDVKLKDNLVYEERPARIVDRQIKILRHRKIPLLKVQWQNHQVEEAIREIEEDMRQRFPQLFE